MRRAEREIQDREEVADILRQALVCRLGLTDGDQPYIVPLCFGRIGDSIYFHAAREGRKLEILKKNDRVCVEFDAVGELVKKDTACGWTIGYRSVVGFGRARVLEDVVEKREGLSAIVRQYGGDARTFPDQVLARTVVIRVDIESMSGKRSG